MFIMLVGVPGSGKSTWARNYTESHPGYYLVSTDQIRNSLYGNQAIQGNWRQVWQQVLHQWRQGIKLSHLGKLNGVIYDATNARRRNRRQVIAAARHLGFNYITLVWFDVPLAVSLKRNQQRSRQVPPDIVVTMQRQIEGAPPSFSEDVDQILRINPGRKCEIFLGKVV